MAVTDHHGMDVQAELKSHSATAQIVRYFFSDAPSSIIPAAPRFRVEMSLTARHATSRACFLGEWPAHRLERIGDIFVVPPNMNVLAKSDEHDDIMSLLCELERDFVLQLCEDRPSLSEHLLVATLDVTGPRVRAILVRICEEVRRPGFGSEMALELMSGLLALELIRHGDELSGQGGGGKLASWQLRRIEERLRDPGAAPTLAELAGLCRLSHSQLARSFKTSRGISLGAYVAARQMEHARQMLSTDLTVASIARRLGFSSSSNFCYAFRRSTGVTPGQFRRNILGFLIIPADRRAMAAQRALTGRELRPSRYLLACLRRV